MISSSGVYASMITRSGLVANSASMFGSPRVPTSATPAGSVSAVSHRVKPSASATATGSTQSVNTSSDLLPLQHGHPLGRLGQFDGAAERVGQRHRTR